MGVVFADTLFSRDTHFEFGVNSFFIESSLSVEVVLGVVVADEDLGLLSHNGVEVS